MIMFTALCRIEYWNDCKETVDKEYSILTHVNNYKDAAERLEDSYGDELLRVDVELVDAPLILSEAAFNCVRDYLMEDHE